MLRSANVMFNTARDQNNHLTHSKGSVHSRDWRALASFWTWLNWYSYFNMFFYFSFGLDAHCAVALRIRYTNRYLLSDRYFCMLYILMVRHQHHPLLIQLSRHYFRSGTQNKKQTIYPKEGAVERGTKKNHEKHVSYWYLSIVFNALHRYDDTLNEKYSMNNTMLMHADHIFYVNKRFNKQSMWLGLNTDDAHNYTHCIRRFVRQQTYTHTNEVCAALMNVIHGTGHGKLLKRLEKNEWAPSQSELWFHTQCSCSISCVISSNNACMHASINDAKKRITLSLFQKSK